jgi:hypothetical protein
VCYNAQIGEDRPNSPEIEAIDPDDRKFPATSPDSMPKSAFLIVMPIQTIDAQEITLLLKLNQKINRISTHYCVDRIDIPYDKLKNFD